MTHRILLFLVLVIILVFSNSAFSEEAAATPAPEATYPSDEDRLDGDHLTLRVNAKIFKAFEDKGEDPVLKCAPKGSEIIVTKDGSGDSISLRFHSVPKETEKDLDGCKGGDRVNESTQYSTKRLDLLAYDFRRSGVTYGGLVVPFKFYLGGDKKISPSSTVAPYIGFRGPAPFGLTFTPIISAGLGLVPVSNPDSDKTETKTALSTAIGLVLSSSKNQSFNAGLIVGKDFLSSADRETDPTVSKAWFSVYLGYSF